MNNGSYINFFYDYLLWRRCAVERDTCCTAVIHSVSPSVTLLHYVVTTNDISGIFHSRVRYFSPFEPTQTLRWIPTSFLAQYMANAEDAYLSLLVKLCICCQLSNLHIHTAGFTLHNTFTDALLLLFISSSSSSSSSSSFRAVLSD